MFKNVMVALGLGPDEEYDDRYFDDELDAEDLVGDDLPDQPRRDRAIQPTAVGDANTARTDTGTVGSVRPIRPATADGDESFSVRPISREPAAAPVTPIAAAKPRVIAPQSFGDAKILADEFKRLTPVIMQLSDVDRDLARRLIDFASGVCYSLGGSMEKMATNVFLLLPKGTEVAADERRRIEERGFDRV